MSNPFHRDSRFAGISFAGRTSSRIPVIRGTGSFPCSAKPKFAFATDRFLVEAEEAPTEESVFLGEVIRSAGLDPSRYRMGPLLRRLPACLRALRASSVRDAATLLRTDPARTESVLNTLLIGTTAFFRDHAVFECLDRLIVPTLLARCPEPRVWSAACSEGSELYSIAMLLARHGELATGQLLGTDFRPRALEAAQRAVYLPEAVTAVPEDLAARFLISGRNYVTVAPPLRRLLEWQRQDIFVELPGGTWDMIFCRNLAIYLASHAVGDLWKRLHACLAPGGILVVGRAEKPRLPGLKRIAPCIYWKAP